MELEFIEPLLKRRKINHKVDDQIDEGEQMEAEKYDGFIGTSISSFLLSSSSSSTSYSSSSSSSSGTSDEAAIETADSLQLSSSSNSSVDFGSPSPSSSSSSSPSTSTSSASSYYFSPSCSPSESNFFVSSNSSPYSAVSVDSSSSPSSSSSSSSPFDVLPPELIVFVFSLVGFENWCVPATCRQWLKIWKTHWRIPSIILDDRFFNTDNRFFFHKRIPRKEAEKRLFYIERRIREREEASEEEEEEEEEQEEETKLEIELEGEGKEKEGEGKVRARRNGQERILGRRGRDKITDLVDEQLKVVKQFIFELGKVDFTIY
jgi:hypothetical protein